MSQGGEESTSWCSSHLTKAKKRRRREAEGEGSWESHKGEAFARGKSNRDVGLSDRLLPPSSAAKIRDDREESKKRSEKVRKR